MAGSRAHSVTIQEFKVCPAQGEGDLFLECPPPCPLKRKPLNQVSEEDWRLSKRLCLDRVSSSNVLLIPFGVNLILVVTDVGVGQVFGVGPLG